MKRWSLEAPFEESRAPLGIETQRQWSEQATRAYHPVAVRALQSGDPLRFRLGPRWASSTSASGLVSQVSSDLQRYLGAGEAASVGQFRFSPIPVRPQCRFSAACDARAGSACGVLLSNNGGRCVTLHSSDLRRAHQEQHKVTILASKWGCGPLFSLGTCGYATPSQVMKRFRRPPRPPGLCSIRPAHPPR
jgi:hypothetical protein